MKARTLWSPRIRILYDIWTDSAWDRLEFIARPLSRIWRGKLQPVLAISPSRLIVGAGANLYSYAFNASHNATSPSVIFEGVISLPAPSVNGRNITDLTFIGDGGFDRTLHVAFQDGTIERVLLTQATSQSLPLSAIQNNLKPMPNGDFVESLSSESNFILTLSATGYVRLGDHRPEYTHLDSSTIELNTRSWVSHLCLQSSTPYAAFGTSSSTPLNVYSITDSQLSPRPFAVLHTSKSLELATDRHQFSAVYGLSRGPLNSAWGSSPQILVSGWFDGHVRCYDLRSSSRSSPEPISGKPSTPAPLRPVLSLADRWSSESIYSVSCGGGSASYIAAGTSRHSVVSFWDIRSPKSGWNVHAPGNDPSPVYSVVLESSRFFGVTQSRPFVYDFVSISSSCLLN